MIGINTEAAREAAAYIAKLNKSVLDDFSEVEQAVLALEREWVGSGADLCAGRMKKIGRTYVAESFSAIGNLSVFLREQVGERYEEADRKVASSAADAFK